MRLAKVGVLLSVAILPTQASGQDLVTMVKGVSIATLDSTMPTVPLESWLRGLTGRSHPVTWEINDCGEGGDGREAPTCVEAIVALGGDTTAHLSLIVADLEGIRRAPPAIWDMSVGAGYRFTGFKTLREWAERVKGQ
ncbi:MAG: hypothetical protein Q8P46_15835 [Hyphomicrobiales bacterium]|nr:hypothetical protein [Hyphomicrobiales bacterium]